MAHKHVPHSDVFERVLPLEGSYNLRDIGGYATMDGHVTRWRTILRSGNLDRLSEESQRWLRAFGLRTVLDLRSEAEITAYPNVFARSQEVTSVHLPLVETDSWIWQADLEEKYELLLRHQHGALGRIVRCLARSPPPLVIHCTAGKDRTGVLMALLLDFVAVPPAVILADYLLSQPCLREFYASVRSDFIRRGRDVRPLERDARCSVAGFSSMLEILHTDYGGASDYFTQIGVEEQDLVCLRRLLLNEAEHSDVFTAHGPDA